MSLRLALRASRRLQPVQTPIYRQNGPLLPHFYPKTLSTSRYLLNNSPPPPKPVEPAPVIVQVRRVGKWRTFLQILGRVTLATILTTGGLVYYMAWKDRHPGEQLPHDPSKKTIVVLGNGWGATSMLKTIDTEDYNVIVISPRNYWLYTPLLPSVPTGSVDPRSIIQPTRYITRHKKRRVLFYEGEAMAVDPEKKTVTFQDTSPIHGEGGPSTINYDYLVYALGAETQTFGIPGAKENSCFLKELWDAEQLRSKTMDCIESAVFPGQTDSEVDRLLHMIVVGGGPTGVELAGEMHDFVVEDLKKWYPELADRVRITLIEALPNVLPMFSKQLIAYTESTFKQNKIDLLTRTMVQEIKPKSVVVKDPSGNKVEIPFGLLVWAGGNTMRPITKDLMAKMGQHQTNKRGLTVDDHMVLAGSNGTIYSFGDCTATSYAPTAQVAAQQGAYVGRLFNQLAQQARLEAELEELKRSKAELHEIDSVSKKLLKVSKYKPFHYSHQGSLAYIGSDKAIADLPFLNGNISSGGVATFLFWRSAYLSNLFSLRNRSLVMLDWVKVFIFGRDVSRD
ncbi:Probable NADH-ubiquinone oxidoreductase C3A11.07, mitochondrial; Flags: Precursor [Serendipita indica DSM 11827]|uniref:NADH:ubiquinone reductase (non-electrogenic) n=1 Tax=Serendipita indica (strain DSM 11827) TaxID=1109443 RepID=G4TLR4_SERID|nr:Probable NADH-ubiquinone oxidoreductase C3A11.07, mitochondrial; Flags: Precursor [Serendipita indica DSM 11827]CCA72259.1 probable NDE1-mitochondrial cytosolically directed NADH dehydrogenase [Serendipita indica DSM 11827]